MTLNEALIRTIVGIANFEKGKAYYQSSAVKDARKRGNRLMADVEGSQLQPYQVTITLSDIRSNMLSEDSISTARCTCPYANSAENYCKHIAAVLITYVRAPAAFEIRPEAGALLKTLSLEHLQTLWQTLLTQQPDMLDWLETAVVALTTNPQPSAVPSTKRPPSIDVKAYRRQITNILRGVDYSRPYQTISGITEQLQEMENQARVFLEAGDGKNALTILSVIAEEVIPKYENLEDETQLSDYLYSWSNAMAEAILSIELSLEERKKLQEQLDDWSNTLADYGSEESVALAQSALDSSSPENLDQTDWADRAEWGHDELTELRLKIAERTQDAELYLAMCLQAGAHLRYAQKLVALGRTTDAHEYALHSLTRTEDALVLAQAFQALSANQQAYEMGVYGLTLAGYKYNLGKWLAVYAESLGKNEASLKGWQAAFNERCDLEIYGHIKRLSGTGWPTLQPTIMRNLEAIAARSDIRPLIEVLLSEGSVDRAIAIWDNSRWKHHTLLAELVDAASATHPNWAIHQLLEQASSEIERGSTHYGAAAAWLKRLKAVYVQHARLAEWTICIEGIRATNSRKRSLLPLLSGL